MIYRENLHGKESLMQRIVLVGIVVFGLAFFTSACRDSSDEIEEELIEAQLDLIENQIESLEKHQENLKQSLQTVQQELEQMDKELDRIRPRVYAAHSSLSYLRELTTARQRESATSWFARNLSVSTQVLLWVLVLWLFYRIRIQRSNSSPGTAAAPVSETPFRPVTPAPLTPTPAPSPPDQAESKQKDEKTTPAAKANAKGRNMGCKVKGCNNKHRSKGFCNKHYQQWRRGTLSEPIEK